MNPKEKKNLSSNDDNFPILKNGIEIIFIILIAVIFLFSFLYVFNNYLGTGSPVAVTTTSMAPVYGGYKPDIIYDEPQLRKYYLPLDGDLLVLKKQTPFLGDTIVFRSESAHNPIPIVHRIVAIQTNSSGNDYYLTKGDNNNRTDYISFGWISEEQIIGVVIGKIPSIGWLSLEIQNVTMRLFLIITLGVLLLLMLLAEENKNINEKTDMRQGSRIFSNLYFKLKSLNLGRKKNKSFKITKMLSTPKGNILTVVLIVVTIFLSFSLQKAIINGNGIKISSLDVPETINAGLDDKVTGFYFIHFDLEILSQGIFNWVYKIELRLNNTHNDVVYTWKIQYSYEGKLVIKSGFPISRDKISSTGNYSINLYYTIYSRGLLAQEQVTELISLNYSF